MNTNETVLEEAIRIVNGERAQDYGDSNAMLERIVTLWEPILEECIYSGADGRHYLSINPRHVALCLIQLKVARELYSPKRDNAVDIAGYAEILSRASAKEMAECESHSAPPTIPAAAKITVGEAIGEFLTEDCPQGTNPVRWAMLDDFFLSYGSGNWGVAEADEAAFLSALAEAGIHEKRGCTNIRMHYDLAFAPENNGIFLSWDEPKTDSPNAETDFENPKCQATEVKCEATEVKCEATFSSVANFGGLDTGIEPAYPDNTDNGERRRKTDSTTEEAPPADAKSEATPKFKTGDRVRLVGGTKGNRRRGLKIGSVGTVLEDHRLPHIEWDGFDDGHCGPFNDDSNSCWAVHEDHLELVDEPVEAAVAAPGFVGNARRLEYRDAPEPAAPSSESKLDAGRDYRVRGLVTALGAPYDTVAAELKDWNLKPWGLPMRWPRPATRIEFIDRAAFEALLPRLRAGDRVRFSTSGYARSNLRPGKTGTIIEQLTPGVFMVRPDDEPKDSQGWMFEEAELVFVARGEG